MSGAVEDGWLNRVSMPTPMKTILVSLAIAVAGTANAAWPYVDVWGGIGGGAMRDINQNQRHAMDAFLATHPAGTATTYSDWLSSMLGVGLGYPVTRDLDVCIRFQDQGGGSSDIAETFDETKDYGASGTVRTRSDVRHTFSMSDKPLLVGVRTHDAGSSPYIISLALFAGIAFATAEDYVRQRFSVAGTGSMSGMSSTSNYDRTDTYRGIAFAMEALLGFMYKVSPRVGIGWDVGYMFLRVSGVRATAADDDTRIARGDYLKINGKAVGLDFSGFAADLRVMF